MNHLLRVVIEQNDTFFMIIIFVVFFPVVSVVQRIGEVIPVQVRFKTAEIRKVFYMLISYSGFLFLFFLFDVDAKENFHIGPTLAACLAV